MTMESAVRPTAKEKNPQIRKVVLSSLVGTVLEYYEFFVYGTMAALVLGDLFFPNGSELAGTLAAFATFGVGFVARPVGSIILGHYGDKLGRKSTLIFSLTVMGVATVAIGLLPTFEAIGPLAPILLVTFRLVQGLALGGEWGGAALMLVENARPERKGLMGSIVMIGVPGGLVLASIITSLSVWISGDQFAAWGWRIPFLVSALLLVIALFIRLSVSETPEFKAAKAKQDATPAAPIGLVFRRHWVDLFLAFGVAAPGNAIFFIIATFTVNYATSGLSIAESTVLIAQGAAGVIYCGTIPLVGLLSDRIGVWRTALIGAIVAGFFIPFYFSMIDTKNPWIMFVAMTIGMAGVHALLQAPQAALFSARFPVAVRYTGVSLSQAIPTTLIGGTVSFIAAWFISLTSDVSLVVIYVLGLAVLGAACSIGFRVRGRNHPIS
ncbi:MFS transporter [Brevibacterium sp. SMBL_HHYL_HB1]|uniref:MFS transporter n=1 Tax=Brevibacterium sp. SMBL_HHYL_HB1 TaxID=2777556 RepID=UPI001BAB38BA|nr:MFS transporter [Brevibacterium sp. SMBL_HHYL_HB1]QUL80258.1 MHS family MFS transporter [Brevibacterium sp. SMBL_HHYL_HB1]